MLRLFTLTVDWENLFMLMHDDDCGGKALDVELPMVLR